MNVCDVHDVGGMASIVVGDLLMSGKILVIMSEGEWAEGGRGIPLVLRRFTRIALNSVNSQV